MKKIISLLILLLMVVGCTAEKPTPISVKNNLAYENFTAEGLELDLVSKTYEVLIEGTTKSCGDVEIEDTKLLKPTVDLAGIGEPLEDVELPIYVKYGDTVCDFEVFPSTAVFDFKVKE